MQKVTATRLGLAGVILGLALATSVPYMTGLVTTANDQVYLGRIPQTVADTAAYYSNIEQVRQGHVLLVNQFTTERQRPSLFHPLWILIGWLAALTRMPTPLVFHVARVLALAGFVVFFWRILGRIFVRPADQWLALGLLCTSSGLGWLSTLLSSAEPLTSFDLWVAESNTFLSLAHSPLFIVSQLLLFATLWRCIRWLDTPSRAGSVQVGGLLLLLTLIHPYDAITAILTMALVVVWRLLRHTRSGAGHLQALWHVVIWAGWTLPVVLYFLLVVLQQPAMAGWFRQNINLTQSVTQLLWGYGLLWPLAAVGWWRHRHDHGALYTTLCIWIVTVALVAFIPGISFQRRLLNGLHIPVAILAAQGLIDLSRILIHRRSQRWVFTGAILCILALTNIWIQNKETLVLRGVVRSHYPPTISRMTAEAIDWVKHTTGFQDVVWADIWNGNAIAGLAGRTVVLGHGQQTINPEGRLVDWDVFRSRETTVAERSTLLQNLRVTWLFWSKYDGLPDSYDPAADPRWTVAYRNSEITVFRLQP